MVQNKIKGVGVALITPFNNYSVDYDALQRMVDHVIEGGVDYIVALGSTAETATLSLKERQQVYDFVVERTAGRVPIVVGGFAAMVYCIDWNNRGYQRFKKAYRLKADYDANPDIYPNGAQDEFGGRYSASFLKNLRNSYRRNRDLCIILTAGIYILQIVDAHVDAHLRDYDISKDLSVSLTPAFGYTYNRMAPNSGGGTTLGMNLSLTF
jgi:hypothetical protein